MGSVCVRVCACVREVGGCLDDMASHRKQQQTNNYLDHLISNTAFLHKHSPTGEWNLYKTSDMSPYQSAVPNVVVFPTVETLDSHSPEPPLLLLHQRVDPKWLQVYLLIANTCSGISYHIWHRYQHTNQGFG